MDFIAAMERDILTARRKALWRPFVRAVREYGLIGPGDRVAVCISGGKDSMLLAVLMRMLQRHFETPFEAVYMVMDPGYAPEHRAQIEANAGRLGIDAAIVESDVFEVAAAQDANPCFLCARMRRGCLYRHARAMGCSKIALGHHFDDVVETTLMAMLYGGQIQAMPPMLDARHFPGMRLIRPMYALRERDIIAWRDDYGLTFLPCACAIARRREDSRRQFVKALIRDLDADNPRVSKNIFNSIHTVQLDTLVGWKYRGERHTFRENLENE